MSAVRYQVLSLATVVAFVMYLDRICLAEIVGSASFKQSFSLSKEQLDDVKGAFFWAYALAQLPAGWLSDRFGARPLISIYILLWSLFTVATSFSWGFTSLMLARLGCGLAEAGYYPASSSMLTRWAAADARGFASSIISWGGRLGGLLAPMLTAWIILSSGDWRWAGWLYGFGGIGVAAAFWWAFRDHPRLHPRCSAAEVELLAAGRGDFLPTRQPPRSFPWATTLRSGNLWLMNAYLFLTNIGWAFLVLTLSDYLKQVLHLPAEKAATYTTIALGLGILGLPVGGYVTDLCARHLGLRRGRALPLVLTRFLAAGCFILALFTDSITLRIICFGGVAFFSDFGLPTVWAMMQDISGRHQAQLFGWCNMWGNFGAALQPPLFTAVLAAFDTDHNYSEGMLLCALCYVLAGLAALGMDGSREVGASGS